MEYADNNTLWCLHQQCIVCNDLQYSSKLAMGLSKEKKYYC